MACSFSATRCSGRGKSTCSPASCISLAPFLSVCHVARSTNIKSTGVPADSGASNCESGRTMEKAIAELTQKIQPLRPRLLGNNQIQINSIPDISEQDNRVSANKQARKPAFGRNANNCPDLLFQSQFCLRLRVVRRKNHTIPARSSSCFPASKSCTR
jgi:hypothetical protein